ncbi:MAG TPA: YfhO family protein, partial [Chloroflexota bacterium]
GAPTALAANLLHPDSGLLLGAPIAGHVAVSLLVAALFLLALATNRIPRQWAAVIALLLVSGDLFLFQGKDAHYFSRLPLALREPSPLPAIERLAGERDFRVAGFQQNGTTHFMSDFPFNVNSALVPPNFGLLYGVEDLQGYLPLRLRSYAEYLAAVNGGQDDYHWALVRNFQSQLLDMLNMRYVMVRDNDARLRNVTIATNLEVRPGSPGVVRPNPVTAIALLVDSYLGNAASLEDGRVVAQVKVTSSAGGTRSFELRAGIETAEWSYDRPEMANAVKHSRPPIAQTRNLPASTHTYRATLTLPAPLDISEVSVEQIEPSVQISVPEVTVVPANPVDRYEALGEINGATLYRNRLALPRVLIVPAAETAASSADALAKIQSPGFDPRKTVILEGTRAPVRASNESEEGGEATIRSRGPNSLSLSVSTASPGFLLLNELSYPGWNAYVDGRRVTVWRANYLFRAIEVPPGEHDVEFRFEPDSLKLGLALTASTLALLLAAAVLRLKFRQQKENTLP